MLYCHYYISFCSFGYLGILCYHSFSIYCIILFVLVFRYIISFPKFGYYLFGFRFCCKLFLNFFHFYYCLFENFVYICYVVQCRTI